MAPISPVGSGLKLIVLGIWGMQAEYLGHSLGTYTSSPSNPSSMGALQPEGTEVYFWERLRA
jgi:hypothetical protein